jgi:hypothetical protein
VEKAREYPNEKRGDERYGCRSRLEWAYFNRRTHHSARMVNFSLSGACFETTRALIPGATVLMRVDEFRPECRAECREGVDCPFPRSITLGEVKWCRDVSETGRQRFGVGVRFPMPV